MTTKLTTVAFCAAALAVASCTDFFNVPNTDQPNQEDLLTVPTRAKLSAAATGIFASARGDIQGHIWRLGSLGREGINLSGNNQPDYQEPYFLPALTGNFGGALWLGRFAAIRSVNIYLTALARVASGEVAPSEKAAARGMANTMKALAFLYIVESRDSLGAPVDVDISITAPPAPFVTKDSVYGYAIGLLDSARADLARAAADTFGFPFPVPPGLSGAATNALDFSTPVSFIAFNRAIAAKARVLRATAAGCGAPCYTAALTDLSSSFVTNSPGDFPKGAYFDFSNAAGDVANGLSEPLNGVTFFAHPSDSVDAQVQPGGQPDQRVINKIVAAQDTQVLGGISIVGEQKFTMYFTGGAADPARPIPVIRDEELVLLRAEAEWFTAAKAAALTDINLVRQNAGGLAPTLLTIASPDSAFVTELMYNRRYSLLWEQGTRWIDARRFHRLGDIPKAPPVGGNVAPVMPIPDPECNARGLPNSCTPLTP